MVHLGRMCGLKDTADRRILDPPLIAQLELNPPLTLMDPQRYIAKVTLCSIGNEINNTLIVAEGYQDCLLGHLVVQGILLHDPIDHQLQIFFIFPELSVRSAGDYRLCCHVIDMETMESTFQMTRKFTVYTSKTYP